jgi:pilus assembly protein Flp/PilA
VRGRRSGPGTEGQGLAEHALNHALVTVAIIATHPSRQICRPPGISATSSVPDGYREPRRRDSRGKEAIAMQTAGEDRPVLIRLDRGQGLAEYALILALIAIVAIIALTFLGTQISSILSYIGSVL